MKASYLVPQLVLAVVSACESGTPAVQHAQLASLAFDVPSDWHRNDTSRNGLDTSVWTPEDNEHKESVAVMRTVLGLPASLPEIETLLEQSKRSMRGASAGSITPIVTARGLVGARLELDYLPLEKHQPYHRVHVVLLDGSALVHVLYTAQAPDAGLGAFTTVLSSIHEVRS
jgi:hypothetical protein